MAFEKNTEGESKSWMLCCLASKTSSVSSATMERERERREEKISLFAHTRLKGLEGYHRKKLSNRNLFKPPPWNFREDLFRTGLPEGTGGNRKLGFACATFCAEPHRWRRAICVVKVRQGSAFEGTCPRNLPFLVIR